MSDSLLDSPPLVTLMMITDGRKECFQRTWESAEVFIKGNGFIGCQFVVNDSQDPEYEEWLHYFVARHTFSRAGGPCTIHQTPRKLGFAGAIQAGWDIQRREYPSTHLFHLEDDFTFTEDIDVGHMITVLVQEPKLAQLVLKRQPVNQEETAAGGIVELHPDDFTEKHFQFGTRDLVWTEHKRFFSTNPCLYRRELTDVGWPQCPNSEGIFSMRLLDLGYRFAFWGGKFDPPKVEHIGINRIGTGY